MPELPNTPITEMPVEGDATFPSLEPIRARDQVAPPAANRQPVKLRTRTVSLRERLNAAIAVINSIADGASDTQDFYLPRSGVLPLLNNLDMGDNPIVQVSDPTDPQDAATKAYVDANVSASAATVVRSDAARTYVKKNGSAGSNDATLDYPKSVYPTVVPPAIKMALGIRNGQNSTPPDQAPYTGTWDIEVWPQILNGGTDLQWFTRVTLGDGAPVRVPEGSLAKQHSTGVDDAYGPYYMDSNVVALGPGGGGFSPVANFTNGVQVSLSWALNTPSNDFHRLTVRLTTGNTAVYLDILTLRHVPVTV